MLRPDYTTRFKKDINVLKKRNTGIDQLKAIMRELIHERQLAAKHADHALKGKWVGCRECHVMPDLLLVYQVKSGMIVFERAGTHSDIFG